MVLPRDLGWQRQGVDVEKNVDVMVRIRRTESDAKKGANDDEMTKKYF
jgi:hypothetical protein